MIADYSAEIKIAIFQSVSKCQRHECVLLTTQNWLPWQRT